MLQVPIGTILPYGGHVESPEARKELEDSGYLVCDGSSYDRGSKDYEALYNVIGYAFGKDGGKFRVPDLRGRFVRGVDHDAKRDPDADKRKSENGGNEGDRVGSVQDEDFHEHTHIQRSLQRLGDDIKKWKFKKAETSPARYRADNGLRDDDNEKSMIHIYTNDDPKEVFPTCPSGGNETRPKNVYVNWIIKAK